MEDKGITELFDEFVYRVDGMFHTEYEAKDFKRNSDEFRTHLVETEERMQQLEDAIEEEMRTS